MWRLERGDLTYLIGIPEEETGKNVAKTLWDLDENISEMMEDIKILCFREHKKSQPRKIDRKEERRKQGERRGREGRERGKEGGREGGEMETNCQGRTMFLFPALLSEVFPSSEADVQHHVKVYLGRKHRLNLPRSRQICCHSACGTVWTYKE